MVELYTKALNIRHALSIHEEEQMNSEEQSATLQRRILDANKHWRPFMSDMHLREDKLTFAPQSPQTSIETSNEITDTFENITK
jgi:ribosomal protein S15P/S13E